MAGRDLLAAAQTGTGKTAAFVLPILHRLAMTSGATGGQGGPRHIRALVLTPTRELALQVEESVRTYGRHRPVRSAVIYGGVGFQPQVKALRAGPAIVVATPGRLLDHVAQRTIDLSRVEILVLDEADRMLDMGFIRDIRRVLAVLPPRRQNLLFSATFSDEIRQLADGLLDRPATIDVAPRNTPTDLVDQVVIPVDRERKRELLAHLVRSGRIEQALVFTRTKHGANRLAEQLGRDGIAAAAIHGNKSQGQRVRALDDFKRRRVNDPRRHGHRRPRDRHRGPPARRQLRAPDGPLGLHPPHRPHRPGGRRRTSGLARVRRRGRAPARHPAAPPATAAVRDRPGLRARPLGPRRAHPAALGRARPRMGQHAARTAARRRMDRRAPRATAAASVPRGVRSPVVAGARYPLDPLAL